jgi:hypothetical protein
MILVLPRKKTQLTNNLLKKIYRNKKIVNNLVIHDHSETSESTITILSLTAKIY